jgi:hypothetical protein
MTDTYLPDGTPEAGPVTTAAVYAEWLAKARDFIEAYWHHDYHPSELDGLDKSQIASWRNRAWAEGELYSLAIREARRMRDRLPHNYRVLACATPDERAIGVPLEWSSIGRVALAYGGAPR